METIIHAIIDDSSLVRQTHHAIIDDSSLVRQTHHAIMGGILDRTGGGTSAVAPRTCDRQRPTGPRPAKVLLVELLVRKIDHYPRQIRRNKAHSRTGPGLHATTECAVL